MTAERGLKYSFVPDGYATGSAVGLGELALFCSHLRQRSGAKRRFGVSLSNAKTASRHASYGGGLGRVGGAGSHVRWRGV